MRLPDDDELYASRFWAKVRRADDQSCWLWTAYRTPKGYGQFRCGAHMVYAHRWAYEAARGPIPQGLQLDHLCRNRACVNPAHLQPVPCRVNLQRSERAGDEFRCSRGHERAVNTYVKPNGHWRCRACQNDARRERRRAEREARHAASG